MRPAIFQLTRSLAWKIIWRGWIYLYGRKKVKLNTTSNFSTSEDPQDRTADTPFLNWWGPSLVTLEDWLIDGNIQHRKIINLKWRIPYWYYILWVLNTAQSCAGGQKCAVFSTINAAQRQGAQQLVCPEINFYNFSVFCLKC